MSQGREELGVRSGKVDCSDSIILQRALKNTPDLDKPTTSTLMEINKLTQGWGTSYPQSQCCANCHGSWLR